MLHDIRYGLRTLRQTPGFSLTAILSIALAIGANATIFSLGDGLLFRPLPVPHAGEVVTLRARTATIPFLAAASLSYADYEDFRRENRSFSGIVAYKVVQFGFAQDKKTQPQLKVGFLVSGNFFRVLGTEPALGRGFGASEEQSQGRDALVVLSHEFWKNEFSASRAVIGRNIRLNGQDFTVIGVAPESFTGMDQYVRPLFFVPAMAAPRVLVSGEDLLVNRSNRAFTVKGRLKPGVSIHAAAADASAIAKSLAQAYPKTNASWDATVCTEAQARREFSVGDVVIVCFLFAIAGVALLIACANVATLMLNRGRARAREIAVRRAIGAGRGRLIRQFMVESMLVALAGGALGLLITQFGIDALSKIQIPSEIPIRLDFELDHRVVWFTLLISVASAILFGVAPALQSTGSSLSQVLKAGHSDNARVRAFSRNSLVIAQVAGSFVLLVAATQLYRGFNYALAQYPGFRTDHLLALTVDTALVRYTPGQTEQFYRTMRERARSAPGVRAVALTRSLPMGTDQQMEKITPEGYAFPRGQQGVMVLTNTVDHNYFQTFGVPIVRGRGFLENDRLESPRAAVVNDTFARRYLGAHPVGRRLRIESQGGAWIEVIGVAATGKYLSLLEPPLEYIYLPLAQHPQTRMTLLAATHGDPSAAAQPLRQIVQSLDANLPIFGVRTMRDYFEQRSVKVLRLINVIVALAGLLGLVLALVGLYAVVAYQVSRRTREIGIRMAIGAHRTRVLQMILKQAATVGTIGIAIGAALSIATGRALASGLGVPSFDPVLFALVPLGLLLTTLAAAAVPARRATQVDPMLALRQD